MLTPQILPTPLPPKFQEYYPGQQEAVCAIGAADERFVVLDAPTGAGKSPIYMSVGSMYKGRTLILVGTKALQDQLMRDFEAMGAVDMRGKPNYYCQDLGRDRACHLGKCNDGISCSFKVSGCDYYDRERECADSKIVFGNYAYWIAKSMYGDPAAIGEFDLMILDEAHTAPEWVSKFCEIELKYGLVEEYLYDCRVDMPSVDAGIEEWATWASAAVDSLDPVIVALRSEYGESRLKKLREVNRLRFRLSKLAAATSRQGTTRWVIKSIERGVSVSPVWPRDFCEEMLFRGVGKVVMASATINDGVLRKMGVRRDQVLWHEVTSRFPVSRRPVYYIPAAKLGYKSRPDEIQSALDVVDRIVAARSDRKGVIMCHAYHWGQKILHGTEYAGRMMTYSSRTSQAVIRSFKTADAPAVLLGPSHVEGVDFPNDECRYIIWFKMPFPVSSDPLVKARCASDSKYLLDEVALRVTQGCGRGNRHANDWCEIFIIDKAWAWVCGKGSFSSWFKQAWRQLDYVPAPPDLSTGKMSLLPGRVDSGRVGRRWRR